MIPLLFDMNQLWEENVLHQLKRHVQKYPEDKWGINGQESKSFCGNNILLPDMVISNDNKIYIIDTKWKRPNNNNALLVI